jgi:hypothetical protein
MSTIVLGQCWPLVMPPTPKAVLISLADQANDQGVCWPSIPSIMKRTCYGRTAVIEAVKWLEDNEAIAIDRSASKSNRYTLTPERFSGDRLGDHHYVYRITHRPTGSFYVGLRSSYVAPELDDYWGSGKACEWLASVRAECARDVIARHDRREDAAAHESELLAELLRDPLCMNRRASAPSQARGSPRDPGLAQHIEQSARRTVREPDRPPSGLRSPPGGPSTVRQTDPSVRQADPNRKEPSVEPSKRARASPSPVPSRPDDVDEQVWSDWLSLRAKKRAPVTATVLTEARREADKAFLSLERFLAIWCVRGSQGLEASWLKASERGAAPAGQPPLESFRERDERLARERAAKWGGRPVASRTQTYIDIDIDIVEEIPDAAIGPRLG